MNVQEAITRVLENCGRADAGDANERTRILQDFRELLTVDIPEDVGGLLLPGFVEFEIGTAVDQPANWDDWYADDIANGIFPFPDRLRTFSGVVYIDDESIIDLYGSRARDVFFAAYDASSPGKPTAILVDGNKLVFRPLPDATTRTVKLYGQVLWDVDTALLDTTSASFPNPKTEALCIAGSTVLEATRRRMAEVVNVWRPIYEGRRQALLELRGASREVEYNDSEYT